MKPMSGGFETFVDEFRLRKTLNESLGANRAKEIDCGQLHTANELMFWKLACQETVDDTFSFHCPIICRTTHDRR